MENKLEIRNMKIRMEKEWEKKKNLLFPSQTFSELEMKFPYFLFPFLFLFVPCCLCGFLPFLSQSQTHKQTLYFLLFFEVTDLQIEQTKKYEIQRKENKV